MIYCGLDFFRFYHNELSGEFFLLHISKNLKKCQIFSSYYFQIVSKLRYFLNFGSIGPQGKWITGYKNQQSCCLKNSRVLSCFVQIRNRRPEKPLQANFRVNRIRERRFMARRVRTTCQVDRAISPIPETNSFNFRNWNISTSFVRSEWKSSAHFSLFFPFCLFSGWVRISFISKERTIWKNLAFEYSERIEEGRWGTRCFLLLLSDHNEAPRIECFLYLRSVQFAAKRAGCSGSSLGFIVAFDRYRASVHNNNRVAKLMSRVWPKKNFSPSSKGRRQP